MELEMWMKKNECDVCAINETGLCLMNINGLVQIGIG